MAIRIFITDEQGLMRAGLRAMLENVPDLQVVGEAATGEEAVRLAGEKSPDLVLMDMGLKDMDGIETTRQMKHLLPQTRVILLTILDDESLLREAFAAGISGYIIKRADGVDLISAIRAVARGEMYVHPSATHHLVKNLIAGADLASEALQTLTPREREVMEYILQGYTNRQIAEALSISTRTVEGHRASALGKLALKNRRELVEFARKYGLIDANHVSI